MAISPITSNTVIAKVAFNEPPADGTRAYQNVESGPEGRKTNLTRVTHEVPVENVRGKEHLYSLDTTGFQFYNRPTKFTEFRDEKKVQEEYYSESIELIKELTGASRVVLFDNTRRQHRPEDKEDTAQKRHPVFQAHVDQTTASSIARVHRHLPAEDVPSLLRRRFQIINLWRPITNPAYDLPLALCNYRSVDQKHDTFPAALVYPDREGETMGIRHNTNQHWVYLRGMTPDEIVLIKCFDSVQDGSVAIFTPHTAFEDPTTPEGSPLRESIELRALVFYD